MLYEIAWRAWLRKNPEYNNSPPYVMARWLPQQIPQLNFLEHNFVKTVLKLSRTSVTSSKYSKSPMHCKTQWNRSVPNWSRTFLMELVVQLTYFHWSDARQPGRGTHIKTYGDVLQNGSFFLQEIPRHGSHFCLKNPSKGSAFQNCLRFP